MQGDLSHKRPSDCPSVKRVHCDKTKETCVYHILIRNERTFIPVLWQKEWLMEGDPFYLKLWVKVTPLERKRRFSANIRL